MPELPEVETVARALEERLLGAEVLALTLRRADLRWPIPAAALEAALLGQRVEQIFRRSKYIVLLTARGYALLHLGMSGRIELTNEAEPARKHAHVSLRFSTAEGECWLHFSDPRRFGCLLGGTGRWQDDALLQKLGVEPLLTEQLGALLFEASRGRSCSVKALLMNAKVVVGVGNIYACEALFRSAIRPTKAAGSVTRAKYERLGAEVQATLREALAAGGTTFRDYVQANGELGYFARELYVYGREGEPCKRCGGALHRLVQEGRSTFYCANCQSTR